MKWENFNKHCTLQQLSSCIVSVDQQIVFHYEHESNASNRLVPINSCTKSIVSTLYAIGLSNKQLPEPNQRIAPWFPEFERAGNQAASELTVEHLLTLSAGFQWDEFGGRNDFPKMTRTPNWIEYMASLPIVDKPGTKWCYNSGISQLLAELIVRVSGQSLASLAEATLLTPLEIANYTWKQDPTGTHTGGYGMRLSALDMLKFGQLWLNRGSWKGQQLFKSSLSEEATKRHIEAVYPEQGYYGWHWWSDHNLDDTLSYYYARGYGGQFIVVVPDVNTIVVFTRNQKFKTGSPIQLFRDELLPGLTEIAKANAI